MKTNGSKYAIEMRHLALRRKRECVRGIEVRVVTKLGAQQITEETGGDPVHHDGRNDNVYVARHVQGARDETPRPAREHGDQQHDGDVDRTG